MNKKVLLLSNKAGCFMVFVVWQEAMYYNLYLLVYGYVNNVYSSRKLEAAVQENIHYMWLAGMNKPDHNTINRFRSGKLVSALRNIFTQVVLLLAEEGLLNIKELCTDGTKIEANANKYSFVWSK